MVPVWDSDSISKVSGPVHRWLHWAVAVIYSTLDDHSESCHISNAGAVMLPDILFLIIPMRSKICIQVLSWGTLLLALIPGGCGQPTSSSRPVTDAVSIHLAGIAAAGEPLTLDELSRISWEPPEGENAAPLYAQAFAALNVHDANSPEFLVRNQEAIALLLRAAELPDCRYPFTITDEVFYLLPHLAKIQTSARLLQKEAINLAASGRTDAASTAILAGFRLARSLDNDPFILSRMVEISSFRLTIDGLLQSLNLKSFADSELLTLLRALSDAESSAGFRRAMLGERANLITAFQASDQGLAQAMAVSDGGGSASVPSSMLGKYRSDGHLRKDFAYSLDFMSNLVAIVGYPYPQALDAAALMKKPTYVDGHIAVSAALLPDPTRYVNLGAEAVARIRLTRAVLAVELYRVSHDGALPNSLAEAASGESGGVADDPFDGQPMRYKKLPASGYTIYSVGADRRDNGGAGLQTDVSPPRDIVMIISRK